jgi:hypothetical protein
MGIQDQYPASPGSKASAACKDSRHRRPKALPRPDSQSHCV